MTKEKIIFGLIIIQIFLLVNMITAESWQVSQMNNPIVNNNVGLKKEFIKITKAGINLLIGFISIKQIGTVSAVGGFCCEKTDTGAYCQNVATQLQCDTTLNSLTGQAYQKSPTTCDQATFCKAGCCVDMASGVCLAGAPQGQCVGSEGQWSETCDADVRCAKGCCVLGSNTEYTTAARCRIKSEMQDTTTNFDTAIPEEECRYYSPEEGACVLIDGTCRRTAELDCKGMTGEFHPEYLCSYFNEPGQKWENFGCKKTDHISCSDKENEHDIYWFDSCGNKENVYLGNDESKKDSSWNGGKIRKGGVMSAPGYCSSDGHDCGSCNYEMGDSMCAVAADSKTAVEAGGFYCKPLNCEINANLVPNPGGVEGWRTISGSENVKVMSGESWCVYDGASQNGNVKYEKAQEGWVGSNLTADENKGGDPTMPGITAKGFFGRDAVGAGHFIRYCDHGDIKTDSCGTGDRGEICQEAEYTGEYAGYMRAQCRANSWFMCFNFMTPEECVASPNVDCRWQGVGVDEYFKFGACVPKYPKGFDLNPGDDETTGIQSSEPEEDSPEVALCNLGSQDCTVTYIHTTVNGVLGWYCQDNCECKGSEFALQMNDFCVSLGDCGGYFNVEGEFNGMGYSTKNVDNVGGVDDVLSGERYVDYKGGDNEINNNEYWKGFEYEEQNTPFWIGTSGSEGTYEDLNIFGAEIDARTNSKLAEDTKNWELGLGIAGGAAVLAFFASAYALTLAFANVGMGAAIAAYFGIGASSAILAGGAGAGVLCFMPDQKISMADGSFKEIKNVSEGDLIKVFNEKENKIEVSPVKSKEVIEHSDVYEVHLSNGKLLKPTSNHPFWIKDKGWASISGLDELNIGAVQFGVNDYAYQINENGTFEWVKITDITPINGTYLTYNLIDTKYGTFVADDIVTHNTGAGGTAAGSACATACWTGYGALIIAAVIIATLITIYSMNLGDTKEKKIKFRCMPWRPPLTEDSEECEKCNDNALQTPCTKYKCESLGSGCRLIEGFSGGEAVPVESGETDGTESGEVNNDVPVTNNPICIDRGKCGVTGGKPVTVEDVFVSFGYQTGSSLSNGVVIEPEAGGRIPENSILSFTLETDDYAVCKYNYLPTEYADFEETGEYFDQGSYHSTNHTLTITIPWIEDERVQNNALRVYVRCIDKCNKYVNPNEYVVEFPINPTPDTTPPKILGTVPSDPSYLAYDKTNATLRVILNENGKCKYDFNQGIPFGQMFGNFTQGAPSENGEEFYSEGPVLNIKKNQSTTIYFKCGDLRGNNNTEDYPHTFNPSPEPLNITSVLPEKGMVRKTEITKDNPVKLAVKTTGGAFGGGSNCAWEMRLGLISVGADNFLENSTTDHEYQLTNQLLSGDYYVHYTCFDLAGNIAKEKTNFTVEKDQVSPWVTRITKEGSSIRLVTNEPAQCIYNSTIQSLCNFDTGQPMDSGASTEHSLSFEYGKIYFIKCKDEFGNQPASGKCSIIVKPEIF